MIKPVGYFVLGVLSTFLIIIVFFVLCRFIISSGDIDILYSLNSPDNKHIATLYKDSGGGAAGWCYEKVSINTIKKPFINKSSKNDVFSINCSSEIKLIWESNDHLIIEYLCKKPVVSLTKWFLSNDDSVKISYNEKETND